ncbi:YheU family protein [Thalassomonas sp. M1454]|uniref:YheU family protein n=1 Tax=Thalassomonas sp. M1454 TaxID=2594477 RepID=UPI00117F9492|nr:YheU family protein [Thalassomonas sp. M1454]TRX55220.1 YheU family protein [Thalassomonas sp. M1454]
MIIPIDRLDTETLDSIIQEYILREGTDYGFEECSMEQKIAQIKAQLKTKKIVLVYSELHETINILPFEQFNASEG